MPAVLPLLQAPSPFWVGSGLRGGPDPSAQSAAGAHPWKHPSRPCTPRPVKGWAGRWTRGQAGSRAGRQPDRQAGWLARGCATSHEVVRSQQSVNQVLGDGLAGLVVLQQLEGVRVAQRPVLHELATWARGAAARFRADAQMPRQGVRSQLPPAACLLGPAALHGAAQPLTRGGIDVTWGNGCPTWEANSMASSSMPAPPDTCGSTWEVSSTWRAWPALQGAPGDPCRTQGARETPAPE